MRSKEDLGRSTTIWQLGRLHESTLLNVMVLRKLGVTNDDESFQKAIRFIETRYFLMAKAVIWVPLQDGRFWDTVLVGKLIESGLEASELRRRGFSFISTDEVRRPFWS